MNEFIGRSRIIVLASHSDETIKSMCNKAALMQEGQIIAFGPVDDVIEQYREMVHADSSVAAEVQRGSAASSALPPPVYNEETIRDVGLADRLGRTNGAVRFIKAVAQDYEVLAPVQDLGFYFRLYRASDCSLGQEVVTDLFEVLRSEPVAAGEKCAIELRLPRVKLMPSEFCLYVCLTQGDGRQPYDVIDRNIDLPAIRIETEVIKGDLSGSAFVNYEIRQIEIDAPPPALVASVT